MDSYICQCDDYWVAKDETGYGNALVLRRPWSSGVLRLFKKYHIKILRLVGFLGYRDFDLSFLSDLPDLEGLDIVSDTVTDVSAVFRLKALRTLSLFCKARIAGDFSELVHLESVALGWRSAYLSVFDMKALRSINIIGYPDKDLARWSLNPRLAQLRLESRKLESLEGIRRFPNVQRVHLRGGPRFSSLEDLAPANSIRELGISSCPGIRDWTPISRLSRLKVLEIENCREIASVRPFAKCWNLERLQVAGNTTIMDGDLGRLAQLPKLHSVLLAQRKHYSHTARQLENRGA
jgi:hypothetical protein